MLLNPKIFMIILGFILINIRGIYGQAIKNLEDTWKDPAIGGKGCGKNFGCFTDPAGCDLTMPNACRNFILFRQNPTRPNLVDFYMEGDGGEDRYLGLGLNSHKGMDGASVLMCRKEKGKPAEVVNTYNQGYKNVPVPSGQERLGLSAIKAGLSADGKRLICSFSKDKTIGTDRIHKLISSGRSAGVVSSNTATTAAPNVSRAPTSIVTVHKVVIINATLTPTTIMPKRVARQAAQGSTTRVMSVADNLGGVPIPYYLIIAESGMANGVPQYHAARSPVVSAAPIDVAQSVSAVTARTGPDVLTRLHGIFMIVGWIFFVSLAILFARHLKSLSPDKTMCGGLKLWFVFHRTANYLALLFIIVGAILIFISIRAWSYDGNGKPLAHSITGILAVILGLLQPIMAFFRPHPGAPKRLIFNWTHRIVGTVAFILALASIFLATKLAKLRGIRTWPIRNIMIAFVVLYALTELVLFALRAYRHRQRQREAKTSYDLNPMGPATGRPIGITNPAYTGNLQPGLTSTGAPASTAFPPDTHKGNKWTLLKFLIISIFGVITLGFVIAMIILIAT